MPHDMLLLFYLHKPHHGFAAAKTLPHRHRLRHPLLLQLILPIPNTTRNAPISITKNVKKSTKKGANPIKHYGRNRHDSRASLWKQYKAHAPVQNNTLDRQSTNPHIRSNISGNWRWCQIILLNAYQ